MISQATFPTYVVCGVSCLTAGGIAWDQYCKISGVFVSRKARFTAELDRFIAHNLATATMYPLLEMYRTAELLGFEDDTLGIISGRITELLAEKVTEIIRSPDDPKHLIETMRLFVDFFEFYTDANIDMDAALSKVIAPADVAAFNVWYRNCRARGWRAFLRILYRDYPPYIAASIGTAVVGMVSPIRTILSRLFLEELRGGRETSKLMKLCVCSTMFSILCDVINWGTKTYAKVACLPQKRRVVEKCAENVARCDTEVLASINLGRLAGSIREDQGDIVDLMKYEQDSIQSVARCCTAALPLLQSVYSLCKGEVGEVPRIVTAGAAVCFVCCAKLAEKAVRWVYVQSYGTVPRKKGSRRPITYALRDTAKLKMYRVHGQEVAGCLALVAEGSREETAEVSGTAFTSLLGPRSTFMRSTVQRVVLMLVCAVLGHGLDPELLCYFTEVYAAITQLRPHGWLYRLRMWQACLRADVVLNLPRTIDVDGGLSDLIVEEGRVDCGLAFEGVSFGYAGGDVVLKNLTLKVPAGQHVGIAGPSGCGKSTLMALVSRLYDPNEGSVILGGRDLKEYNAGWLRREVVSGTGTFMKLVDGSIYDNVKLSHPAATPEEAMQALRMACAVDFVQEKGLLKYKAKCKPELSAGQEARVFLARALVAKPKILVLDEVSAHLDPVVEEALRKQLAELTRAGTTIINVSHRLSFLKNCDIVHVFDEVGEISASGTHKHLLKTCEWFKEACNNQMVGCTSAVSDA